MAKSKRKLTAANRGNLMGYMVNGSSAVTLQVLGNSLGKPVVKTAVHYHGLANQVTVGLYKLVGKGWAVTQTILPNLTVVTTFTQLPVSNQLHIAVAYYQGLVGQTVLLATSGVK